MLKIEGATKVKLSEIVEDPALKLREVVAENPEFQALCESVKRHGVIEPVLVRPAKGEGGKYSLVDGYQRVAAAKAVGVKEVPIITTSAAPKEAVLAAFDLNSARVAMSPMVEAKAVARAMEVLGTTKATEIAPKMGKSPRWVSIHTELLELPEEIQKALDTGDSTVTIGKCHELLRLSAENRGAFIEPLRRLTEPYFKDHVEKAVESGDAEWVGGSKAPKKAKEDKKTAKENADKHNKKVKKEEAEEAEEEGAEEEGAEEAEEGTEEAKPEEPKEPELEVRSVPALLRAIRKVEKIQADLRTKREEIEAKAKEKAKGKKKEEVSEAVEKALSDFDEKNALPMAYLKGEVAFGLYALGLNTDAESLDAALEEHKGK